MARPTKGRKVALVAGCALLVVLAMVGTYWKELRSWYALWRDFERIGRNEQGYPEYLHRQTGIVFVSLPGGTFEMGSPEDEEGRSDDEGPVHEVTLSPFLIAKYEVSQVEWAKVMVGSPFHFKGDTLPVENVSWEDCQEFCEKTGLSLPTEAQWEYACRAGTKGPYAGTGDLNVMGWYDKSSLATTSPVGQKRPNDFGLHDMHGNVLEWCADWYQADYYEESAAMEDPIREKSSSEFRVIRGGGRLDDARQCRSAFRHSDFASRRFENVGFRPVWLSFHLRIRSRISTVTPRPRWFADRRRG